MRSRISAPSAATHKQSGDPKRIPGTSQLPRDGTGRLYHLGCRPGDIAPYILAVADPSRASRIAERIGGMKRKGEKREYIVYTGTHAGIPLTVMGTGIGAPATAIAVVEAAQCEPAATFIRIGTCGALQAHMNIGDLVITEGVIRDENTTAQYVAPDVSVAAHPRVVRALEDAARDLNLPHYKGTTCTTSDFFAGQGRIVPGFPIRDADKVRRLSGQGVLNFEMEMSVFLTLAQVSSFNLRAGGVTVVLANRIKEEWVSTAELAKCEEACVSTGLRAVEILHDLDTKA